MILVRIKVQQSTYQRAIQRVAKCAAIFVLYSYEHAMSSNSRSGFPAPRTIRIRLAVRFASANLSAPLTLASARHRSQTFRAQLESVLAQSAQPVPAPPATSRQSATLTQAAPSQPGPEPSTVRANTVRPTSAPFPNSRLSPCILGNRISNSGRAPTATHTREAELSVGVALKHPSTPRLRAMAVRYARTNTIAEHEAKRQN